ncbi:hypothetical protein FQN54_005448 [Arachnomyces sp. PD_36]|nr:hypothetical protein FQN54_005448 [Arachnomyces sp. PD_36]
MVLLTSSSISLAISTSIIFLFTFLLFLCGYVLQQQTVRGLQEALRTPPPPIPTPTLPAKFQNISLEDDRRVEDVERGSSAIDEFDEEESPESVVDTGRVGKEFGHPPGSPGHQSYEQSVLSSEKSDSYGREPKGNQQAYIQLLSNPDPSELCSAILLFKTLQDAGDSVRSDRLLLYPRSWDLDPPSPDMEAAMGLLHAPGGGLEINRIPVDVSGGLVSSLVEEELRESSLSLLRQYTSVLYLPSPGLIIDAKKLDSVFHTKALEASSSSNGWETSSPWVPISVPEDSLEESNQALSTVLFVSSTGPVSHRSSLEFYIPSPSSPDFASLPNPLVAGDDTSTKPIYVHFQLPSEDISDTSSYFRTWKEQRQEMCPGINLTDSQ